MAWQSNTKGRSLSDPVFWDKVRSARARFLGLDYDGTLAPFHVDPMKAVPYPRIRETLEALRGTRTTKLAILSGRPVAELITLLGNLKIILVGSHGFELVCPDGVRLARYPRAEQQEGLKRARSLAIRLGLEKLLETKLASLALHTRGMAADVAVGIEEQVSSAWSRVTAQHGLECRRFNGGVEIRATGWHKGDALRSLLSSQPEGTLAVYIGDDETDEDAFRMIRGRGLGIRVGLPPGPTAARAVLPDCRAVLDFLTTWLTVTSTQIR